MGVIRLLGASVADQIAAGEVVNRPSSVVKELMENAVDSGATKVTLIVNDAGHTLVQVIDNGCGMSAEDALTAFQRHATSKIQSADDLYKLTTFGFRGEALPSIASVSQVEMRTRREEDDLGVEISIAASVVNSQKEVHCPVGTTISVRNLFFNTPARRKFLKSTSYEKRVIISEFEKIAMANPHISFTLQSDNDPTPTSYRPATLRQRVADIVKRTIDKALLPVDLDTQYLSLKGWVSTPQQSGVNPTKNSHFFVNGRFMRNMSLQKAVAQAYGRLLPQGHHPFFYIFIDIEPSQIDVNIHPTKTEIKFEDEQLIWQMINSAVRKTLGSASVAPSLDFANPVSIDIPVYTPLPDHDIHVPRTTSSRGGYNPFSVRNFGGGNTWNPASEFDPEQIPFQENLPPNLLSPSPSPTHKLPYPSTTGNNGGWEELPSEGFGQSSLDIQADDSNIMQWNNRYLICPSQQGLMLVDYPRAMERVAYEKLLKESGNTEHSQLELIPEQLELSNTDAATLIDSAAELSAMGFEIGDMGGGHITVYSMPAALTGRVSASEAIEELLEVLDNNNSAEEFRKTIISALARSASRVKPRLLKQQEITQLLDDLFACSEPGYTPAGLPVITTLTTDEIEKRFKRR